MLSKNLGGDRLGSGNKMKIQMRNYERSTHDLSYLWKSTMATGTLVPYMKLLGLPGDTFDINLNAHVMTLPTVGPLFGSFKLQLDVFVCPIRLYNAQLHMNKLNVGLDMSKVKFPIGLLSTNSLNSNINVPTEVRQLSQSSLLALLLSHPYLFGGCVGMIQVLLILHRIFYLLTEQNFLFEIFLSLS